MIFVQISLKLGLKYKHVYVAQQKQAFKFRPPEDPSILSSLIFKIFFFTSCMYARYMSLSARQTRSKPLICQEICGKDGQKMLVILFNLA